MINRRITMAKKKAVNDSDRYAGLVQPGTSLATEFMETGNIGLDMAISDGRGMPIGGVVTFFAGPGCGKSTTCVDVSKRLLKKWHEAGLPYKILYIDIEKSNDLMNNMGLSEYIDDGTFLLHPNLCTFQTLQNYCDDILAGNGPMENVRLIIIDSLQNLICGRELENGIETGDFGDAVRYRNRFYKAYLPQLKARGISCLFVSQQRKKQALINPRENPNKSALTDGDKHYADTLLYFTKTTGGNNAETKKKKYRMASSNEDVGISDCFIVTMKIDGDKNRYGSRGEVKTLCKYGVGSDNWWILHNILKQFLICCVAKLLQKNQTATIFQALSAPGAEDDCLRFSDITSNLSPACNSRLPLGIINSFPRLTSITSVPAGRFMSASRLPSSKSSAESVTSRN